MINNIHFLFEEDSDSHLTQANQALVHALLLEHRAGEHTYGNMRRECPLCQQNK